MQGRGRGRGDGRCKLVLLLLLKWIVFRNILFLRKLFYVSVFMAPGRENSRAAEPNSCSSVLPFGEQGLG